MAWLEDLRGFFSNLNDSVILWLMPYCTQPNELCFLTLQFLSPSVFFSMWLLYIGLFYYTNLKWREKALQFAPILSFCFSFLPMNKENTNKNTKNQKQKPKPKPAKTKNPNKQTTHTPKENPNKTNQQQNPKKPQTNNPPKAQLCHSVCPVLYLGTTMDHINSCNIFYRR